MYIIMEIQTNNGVSSVLPIHIETNKNNALSIYYSILAAAALSNVRYHTAMIIDEQGKYIARECYEHPQEQIENEEGGDE